LNIKRFRLAVQQDRVRVSMEKGFMDDQQYGFLDNMTDEEVVKYNNTAVVLDNWLIKNSRG
jgi:hypothetical protein